MMLIRCSLILFASLLAAGCASVISGDQQKISISVECKGMSLPAYCVARNTEGQWRFKTPATITVNKSHSDLRVICESGTFQNYSSTVSSSINTVSFGNIIAGGLLGAAIDYQTSSGLEYPSNIIMSTPLCRLL